MGAAPGLFLQTKKANEKTYIPFGSPILFFAYCFVCLPVCFCCAGLVWWSRLEVWFVCMGFYYGRLGDNSVLCPANYLLLPFFLFTLLPFGCYCQWDFCPCSLLWAWLWCFGCWGRGLPWLMVFLQGLEVNRGRFGIWFGRGINGLPFIIYFCRP